MLPDKKHYLVKIAFWGVRLNFIFTLSSKKILEKMKDGMISRPPENKNIIFKSVENDNICILANSKFVKYKDSYILVHTAKEVKNKLPSNLPFTDKMTLPHGLYVLRIKDISKMAGAKNYSTDIKILDKNDKDYHKSSRYLFDHTSKSKQEY